MINRRQFTLSGLSTTAIAALGTAALAKDAPASTDTGSASHFDKCARACSDCQRACDACADYCAKSLTKGPAQHFDTLVSCLDCANVCSNAAQIVARRGSMADLICHACADACARCAHQCEHHGGNDSIMTHCAQECRKCETACREMLKHVGAEHSNE